MNKYAAALSVTTFAVSSVPAIAGPRPVTDARYCRNTAADVVLGPKLRSIREIEARGLSIKERTPLIRAQIDYWENQRRPQLIAECQSFLAANTGSAWVPPEK